MSSIARRTIVREVVIGIDTYEHIHVAIALDELGGRLGELTVATDRGDPFGTERCRGHRGPPLRHPDLVFYVDVTLTEHERPMARDRDAGRRAGHRDRRRSAGGALRAALAALGEPFASEMAREAELPA